MNFDWNGTRVYLLTGEQAAIEVDEFLVIQNTQNCTRQPAQPAKSTIGGYTGSTLAGG